LDSGGCFESIMKQRFTVSASRELWEFVPLERYVIPGDTQNWVRKKRRTLGRLFGPARTEAQSRVLAISGPPALTLQAFDGCRLARHFFQLTCGSVQPRPRVCSATTGRSILPDEETLAEDDFEASIELRQLAAHCRGNLGTAWKYWRTRLRTEGDAETSDEVASNDYVLWLADDPTEPVLPAETGEEAFFVLHALLLHNGLPAERLSELLPMLRSQIVSNLLQLESLGLVESCDGFWRVAALGYAAVGDLLAEHQYLTDSF
jgi:hypothetical protein